MKINGDTLITVQGDIKPIRIGDSINNGKSKIVSVAMPSGVQSGTIDLLVSGDFKEDELIY